MAASATPPSSTTAICLLAGRIRLVVPTADGQGGHSGQHLGRIHGLEVLLEIPVTGADEGTVHGQARRTQAHERGAAAGIPVGVVVRTTKKPVELTRGSEVFVVVLHANAVGSAPQVEHLPRRGAKVEITVVVQDHIGAVGGGVEIHSACGQNSK